MTGLETDPDLARFELMPQVEDTGSNAQEAALSLTWVYLDV